MLFNSLKFLFFFPVVFLSYWVLPHRFRKYFLLAASYYFYMCWKAEFIVLVLLSTAVDYFCGLGMARFPKKKKVFLIVSLKTLIISKKPGNTGISRDMRTEFTTHLLHSD